MLIPKTYLTKNKSCTRYTPWASLRTQVARTLPWQVVSRCVLARTGAVVQAQHWPCHRPDWPCRALYRPVGRHVMCLLLHIVAHLALCCYRIAGHVATHPSGQAFLISRYNRLYRDMSRLPDRLPIMIQGLYCDTTPVATLSLLS